MSTRFLLVCGALFGAAALSAAPGDPSVSVDSPRMVSGTAPRRYVGSVTPIEYVVITPRVTGTLKKVCFKEGSAVKKGDLLYELEDTTYRAAVERDRAQKELLEATLRFATAEFNRNKTLLKSKAVSTAAYDKALLDIDSAKANLKNLEASLLDAENTLSYTRITAPISGRTGKNLYAAGNLLTPSTGKLTDIEAISPIDVKFSISERAFRTMFGTVEDLKRDAVVQVQLADGTLYSEKASVTLADNKISGSTNTITLWAKFANQDEKLLPGGFVTVLLSGRLGKELPAIPPSALIPSDRGMVVYVLDQENKVAARPVKVAGESDSLTVISEGLTGKETVIVDGTHKVRPGMRVNPVRVK